VNQLDPIEEKLQKHAAQVLVLQKQWSCDKAEHQHEGRGHCYVKTDGTHLRLSKVMLATWAEQLALGEVTKREPPNIPAFDPSRVARPRGIAGRQSVAAAVPEVAVPQPPPIHIHNVAPAPAPASDLNTALNALLVPLLIQSTQSLVGNRGASLPNPPVAVLPAPFGAAQQQEHLHEPADDLRICFERLKTAKGIDATALLGPLQEEHFTPEAIGVLETGELGDVLPTLLRGDRIVVRKFCRDFAVEMEERRRA